MSDAPSPPSTRDRLLAFTWVGELPLALDGSHIAEIEGEPAGEAASVIDLFDLLGLECSLARADRRAVRLDEGDRWLLVGDRLELGAVEPGALHRLPPFLTSFAASRGLVGFVSRAGVLFSLFDPVHFLSRARITQNVRAAHE